MPDSHSQLTGHNQNPPSDSYSAQSVFNWGGLTISNSISITASDDVGSSPSRQVVPNRRPERRSGDVGLRPSSFDPSVRDEIRRGVLRAIGAAKEMTEAAQHGDPMELSNAGFNLGRYLDELWGLRKHRESNWGDLVNLIQGALTREEFERFEEEQCKLIGDILAYHLRPSPVEDDDLRSSVQLLRRAKLDPWKGLSQAKGS